MCTCNKPAAPTASAASPVVEPLKPLKPSVLPELRRWRMEANQRFVALSWEEISGCRLSESSREARLRDQTYTDLLVVQEQIDAAIADERAAELEGA
jgi:predicted nucleic acid-binding Zn ribbon protein